jgi:predicted kinase
MRVMLKVAGYTFRNHPLRHVFLDGRTFSRRYQLARATGYADAIGQSWMIIECVCSEKTARERLEGDASHVAANRDFQLYLEIKARFEDIAEPKIVIDTDYPLSQGLDIARAALKKGAAVA